MIFQGDKTQLSGKKVKSIIFIYIFSSLIFGAHGQLVDYTLRDTTVYNEEGQIIYSINEINSRECVVQRFWNNGILKNCTVYKMGKDSTFQVIRFESFLSNGTPLKIVCYKNGRFKELHYTNESVHSIYKGDSLHGYIKYFYHNGQLQEKGPITNGFRYGKWKGYHEDGQKSYKGSYSESFVIIRINSSEPPDSIIICRDSISVFIPYNLYNLDSIFSYYEIQRNEDWYELPQYVPQKVGKWKYW